VDFQQFFVYIQAQEVKASPVLKLEKTNFDAEVETGVVFVKVGHFYCFFYFYFLLTLLKKRLSKKRYRCYGTYLYSDRTSILPIVE
jgi:hypothetical protein